jgi:hypothetical protein
LGRRFQVVVISLSELFDDERDLAFSSLFLIRHLVILDDQSRGRERVGPRRQTRSRLGFGRKPKRYDAFGVYAARVGFAAFAASPLKRRNLDFLAGSPVGDHRSLNAVSVVRAKNRRGLRRCDCGTRRREVLPVKGHSRSLTNAERHKLTGYFTCKTDREISNGPRIIVLCGKASCDGGEHVQKYLYV